MKRFPKLEDSNNRMFDPQCTGELILNPPRTRTGEELLANGPVTVFAIPSEEERQSSATDRTQQNAYAAPDDETDNSNDGSRGGVWAVRPSAPGLSSDSPVIWHYTDAAGFIGVISHSQVWATALGNLNDTAEFSYGRKLLDHLLSEVNDSRHVHPIQKSYINFAVGLMDKAVSEEGLFVVCASTASHSLAQWRAYGGKQGHAVLLDPRQSLAVMAPTSVQNKIDTIPHSWKRVLYDEQDQRRLLLDGLSTIAYSTPNDSSKEWRDDEAARAQASLIAELVAYCKEPSFREEQEVRMVVQAPSVESIQFRSSSTGITPYLCLTGTEFRTERTKTKSLKLPIVGCVVGPFDARKSSAFAAGLLLNRHDYAEVPIEISSSTLR